MVTASCLVCGLLLVLPVAPLRLPPSSGTLKTKGSRARGSGQSAASSRENEVAREKITPVYWLHIPKAGSSFATAIAHTTCGDAIPRTEKVMEPKTFFEIFEAKCSPDKFWRFETGHGPLAQDDPKILPHTVMMLRNPAQRILSGYFHFPDERLHDCPEMRRKYHCEGDGLHPRCHGDIREGEKYITNPDVIPPVDYAKCVANCSSNMLTGKTCGAHYEPVNLTLALLNLEKLGFVGLTEEWELSVCLWHKRFGGVPLAAEITNTRPGLLSSHSYDVKRLLGDWKSETEEAIHAFGKKRFFRELAEAHLTREKCAEMLSDAKAVENENSRGVMSYVED